MASVALRKLYHLLRIPYYPSYSMEKEQFIPLNSMTEKQAIVGTLVQKLEGKDILDIGCGYLPIYKYMGEGSYRTITCIDPILENSKPMQNIEVLGIKIEELQCTTRYDTVLLLGLSHMNKHAFEAINKILATPSVRNFILEHAKSAILPIYTRVITKELPKLKYSKKFTILLEYRKNILGNRRFIEVWTR